MECGPPLRRIDITDVKLLRCEPNGDRFETKEPLKQIKAGDLFTVIITIQNHGGQEEHFLTCYSWTMCPDDNVLVIGSDSGIGGCTGHIELQRGESVDMSPFTSAKAFEAKQAGRVAILFHLADYEFNPLCDHAFTFVIEP